MKKLLVFLLISVLSFNIQAQEKSMKENEVEFEIDSTSVLTLILLLKPYTVSFQEKKE